MAFDHHDAADIAETIDGPAARAFVRTGKITPGFRAAVALHADRRSDLDELSAYVADRVEQGATGRPADWPA